MDGINYGSYKLLELINRAYNGEVMLPDFQRNFVWKREDIEELIKSILEGIFIGPFIFLHVTPKIRPFKTIFIDGVKLLNPDVEEKPTLLILDGQQRITSLFYSIYWPNIPLRNTETPYGFFLDIEKLLNDDIDNSVISYSKKSKEYKSFVNQENLDYNKLAFNKKFPLNLFKNTNKLYDILYEYYKKVLDENQFFTFKKYIEKINNYSIHAFTLDISFAEHPEEIVKLFEKINKTGIRLSVYDILNARIYKFIKLREVWENTFYNNEGIKKYANRIDNTDVPYSFIQALMLKHNKGIKSKEIIKYANEQIINEKNWEEVVKIAEHEVIPRLKEKYGVINFEKWLPYRPCVTLLIAFYLNKKRIDEEKIDTWYWCAIFSEWYSGSTETKMAKDYKEVLEWFTNKNKIPDIVSYFREELLKNLFSLRKVRNKGSSIYKGIFNILFKNKPIDFYQHREISYSETDLEDHHIFPKKFLESKNINNEEVNSILNRTLLLSETNKQISNKSPGKYIQEMINGWQQRGLSMEAAEEKVKNILKNHFINEKMFEILKETTEDLESDKIKENFEKFIQKREELLLNEIKKLVKI
jgi:hypothetical protein